MKNDIPSNLNRISEKEYLFEMAEKLSDSFSEEISLKEYVTNALDRKYKKIDKEMKREA